MQNLQFFDFAGAGQDVNGPVDASPGTLDLRVSGMSDNHDIEPLAAELLGPHVDFGNQGACGIDDAQIFFPGGPYRGRGNSVGAENDRRVLGHFLQALDEHGAPNFEVFHDMPIMNNFVQDVSRPSVTVEGLTNDFDGSSGSGAKPSRLGQNDLHRAPP